MLAAVQAGAGCAGARAARAAYWERTLDWATDELVDLLPDRGSNGTAPGPDGSAPQSSSSSPARAGTGSRPSGTASAGST